MDLFDYKPALAPRRGEELPESIRQGQRLTSMTSEQGSFPVAPSIYEFAQHGQSGAWISELLPRTAEIADDLCFIRSMHTEAINHDPAVTFLLTGAQIAGRPSLGSWLAYGLGNENSNLPAFVVMVTQGTGGQPLYDRLWGSGFLPSRYQGVKFRSVGDPVLYLSDPKGFGRESRRHFLDALNRMNRIKLEESGDPEISARISQYEMAFRMQTSVPELTDLSGEPDHIFQLYGEDARKPGTFASNCLLARRLAERGVRFHPGLPPGLGSTREAAHRPPQAVQGHRPGLGRAGAGPEAEGNAGGHAGGLGRRVRADRLLPGTADRVRLRPRPSSPVLHHPG